MKIFPIISNNQFFGHYGSWWRLKFLDYKYYLGQGESIWGEVEGILATGGIVGMLVLVLERWFGWLMPWQLAVGLGVGFKLMKIWIGILDKDIFKTGQAQSEYSIRKRLNPIGNEMLDRQKNTELMTVLIFKKIYGIELTEEEKKLESQPYREEHITYLPDLFTRIKDINKKLGEQTYLKK